LNEGSDDEDIDNYLHIFGFKGDKDVVIDDPCDDGGEKHNEGYGDPHTDGIAEFFRDAKERAESQKTREDKVVDESHPDEDRK
jgi:hypothetical protein